MTVSFLHGGGPHMASYRYRVQIPAQQLGWSINDPAADVLIFSKPVPNDLVRAEQAKSRGATMLVDVCDAHLHRPEYQRLILMADGVTCSSAFLKQLIEEDLGPSATVIDDPYECEEAPPHVTGGKLFWFGHASNLYSLDPYLPLLKDYDVRVMSNGVGTIPWSPDGLRDELAKADIVILPETAPYKSANRAVEAIRSGCFVVADPHPSLDDLPGIWTGNIVKGVAWASQNPSLACERLTQSQAYVRARYMPERVANAWKMTVRACVSNSDVAISRGRDGSTLTANDPHSTPTLLPT